MKSVSLVMLFLLLVVSLSSFANATALIKSVPAQKFWTADGVTEYRIDVYADNTGLNGEFTDAVQWRLLIPDNVQPYVTITRATARPENDFFAGSSMFWERVNTIQEDLNSRIADLNQGKSNTKGNIASYWFTLSPGAPRGLSQFDFSDVKFIDPNNVNQDYTTENGVFYVLPSNKRMSIAASCRFMSC